MRLDDAEQLQEIMKRPAMREVNPDLVNPDMRRTNYKVTPLAAGSSNGRAAVRVSADAGSTPAPAKPHKYHAQPTEQNGRRYPSKKQAQYAADLALRKAAGEISFWLEEVPFLLPGVYTDKRGRQRRAVYRLDFMVFYPETDCGGCWSSRPVMWIEIKGKDLPQGKLKRLQVEALYGIHIVVV